MKVQLLQDAQRALALSVVDQIPVGFSKFRIGKTVKFTPNFRASDVDGFVYEGRGDAIRTYMAKEGTAFIIEISLDHSIGNFDIGNVMVFDNQPTPKPFVYAVRDSAIPKVRTVENSIGTETKIQIAVPFLASDQPANVTVELIDFGTVPTVSTEAALTATQANQSPFPLYVVENFNETNMPALLYANAVTNQWFINPYFQDLANPARNVVSGGRAGDNYKVPVGKIAFGGEFGDNRIPNVLGSENFNPNDVVIINGGGTFS